MELESESESDVEQASKEPTEQGHGCFCCCTSRKKMSLPCKPSQCIYLPCCCGEDRREPPYHVRILFLPMVLNPSCVQVSGFRLHALGSCTHHVKQPWRWRREPPCLCFLLSGAAKRAESARVFTIINQCKTVIWPAVTPGESFGGGGFALRPGQSMMFTAPEGWSGRIWGRTDCNFDAGGNGSCATGSCGSALKCGSSGATPASLAEFTLASVDYYDVSLVDGFNLPMVIKPVNGQGNCSAAGCDGDLRLSCPSELAVKANGRTVACRSACDVFATDQYCCRGLFGNPATCQPTFYSKKFKAACPTAYSYAYDDPTSIFTCSNADYVITFCSNRKQSVCSYHNNQLVCSDSSRSLAISMSRLMLVLLLSFLALQFSV